MVDPSAPDAWVNGIMEGREWVMDPMTGGFKEAAVERLREDIEKQTRARTLDVREKFKLFEKYMGVLALDEGFVIHKTSRGPREDSYDGPTWDKAGIRHKYRKTYRSHSEATAVAIELGKHNPVGFMVSRPSKSK